MCCQGHFALANVDLKHARPKVRLPRKGLDDEVKAEPFLGGDGDIGRALLLLAAICTSGKGSEDPIAPPGT